MRPIPAALDSSFGDYRQRSVQDIRRTVLILLLMVLAYAGGISRTAWTDEKSKAVQNLTTVVEIEALAIDGYFSHLESDLKAFGDDLPRTGGKIDLDQAFVMAKQLKASHSELFNVALTQADGEVLLTARAAPGTAKASLANSPSFIQSMGEFRQGRSISIGQPLLGLIDKEAVVPMRYAMRDSRGQVIYIVVATLPHAYLQSFWKNAPVTAKAAIGIMRDNGFFLSRYPVPANLSLEQLYGQPRTGALLQHLQQQDFPERGDVQGQSSFADLNILAAFRRLPTYPLTLFVSLPMSEVWTAWWSRVGASFFSLLVLLAGGWGAYWLTQRRQKEWHLAQQASELALRESEERFRFAMEASNDGLWDWHTADDGGYFSPAYYRMLGYGPSAFPMTGQAWSDLLHPDDRQRVLQVNQDCIENRTQSFNVEFRMQAQDGSWKWILGRGKAASRDASGRALRMVGTHEDITGHKAAEDALRTARAEAEQANNAKSRFLAAASHDLRQPLAALSLYVEVLKIKKSPPDEKLLSNMTNCVTSLSELLTDLLDISKLEAGVVTPEPSNFAVSDLLSRLVAVHTPHARRNGQQLRCRSTDLHAHTDRVLMARMLDNLIANAIRYTDRGGVLIACRRHQGKTWIEIWDSGIGIPADKTQEIFEEYRQLKPSDQSRGSGSKGSGLGLAIVAKSAALMGLEIRVESRLGRGSMFAVELPLGAGADAVELHATIPRSLRIALVDDNTNVLDALGSALGGQGHQVVAAASGTELLRRLEGEAPDLLISDYRLLNGETGVNVIAAVRQAFGEKLPALIITGDTDPKFLLRMVAKRITVQHKPLKFDAFLARIAQLMKA